MLRLFDTAGKEEYWRLRPFDYPQTDIFLVFTRIGIASTYRRAEELWVPEITHHCPGVPFIIVGIGGHDAVEPTRRWNVTQQRSAWTARGKDMATRLGALWYDECSILAERDIEYIFERVRHSILGRHDNTRSTTLTISMHDQAILEALWPRTERRSSGLLRVRPPSFLRALRETKAENERS
jgi:hypothetical protein